MAASAAAAFAAADECFLQSVTTLPSAATAEKG
jgi:hypothetical protein